MIKHALLAVSAASFLAFASGCGCINECMCKHSWYGDADCCGNNHCIDHRFGEYGFGACGECGAPCADCGCNGGCPGYNQCASGCCCDECDRYDCPLTHVWRFCKGIFHSPGPVGPCYDCGCANGGCGEKYCCDWINCPPTCDPCDHCGNYCGCHDPKPCYQATPRFGGVPMGHAESVGAVDDGVIYEGHKTSAAATR
jgi:hypothetical protein